MIMSNVLVITIETRKTHNISTKLHKRHLTSRIFAWSKFRVSGDLHIHFGREILLHEDKTVLLKLKKNLQTAIKQNV